MNPLTTFVRHLGNGHAVDNAAAATRTRLEEDWLVLGLISRLAALEAGSAADASTRAA